MIDLVHPVTPQTRIGDTRADVVALTEADAMSAASVARLHMTFFLQTHAGAIVFAVEGRVVHISTPFPGAADAFRYATAFVEGFVAALRLSRERGDSDVR